MEKFMVNMKKLLFILFLPCFVQAQKQDTATVIKFTDVVIDKVLSNGDTTWKFNYVTKPEHASLTSTVNTINGIQTLQGQSITALQTQVAGITIVTPPVPRVILDNAYTLTEADNGSVLVFPATATVTCPPLFAGFKVKIIRTGSAASAVVTINGANSVYGYKRLTIQYADGDINYITNSQPILTGRISK